MPVTLGSNISALRAQHELGRTSNKLVSVVERLSSGLRINRASDDAAGLALASDLQAKSRVLAQAVRNVNDTSSLLTLADAALEQLSAISARQLELAMQAASSTYSAAQRRAFDDEANALVEEFNRIITDTVYNERQIFEVNQGQLSVQAGNGAAGNIAFQLAEKLAHAAGDGTFTTVASAPTTLQQTYQTILADLDNDGVLDMIIGGYNGDGAYGYPDGKTLRIRKGLGNGSFSAETIKTMSGPVDSIEVGDLNGDGALDIVSAGYGGVHVLMNQGNGTFSGATLVATEQLDIALADLDNDGVLDLVGQYYGTLQTDVYLGNGNGTFRLTASYANQAGNVALGDVNNDGTIDMVTSAAASVTIRLGQGDGTFAGSLSYAHLGGASDVQLGDLDRDGNLDLITVHSSFKVQIRFGAGDGTFGGPVSYGMSAGEMQLVDLDNDGVLDMTTSMYGSPTVIRINNGDGTFGSAITYNTFTASGFGDLNGDGVLDLVSGGSIKFANTHQITTIGYVNLLTQQGALEAQTVIERTLERVQSERGVIGANQSRLESTLGYLQVTRENYAAAADRINTPDHAHEVAELVRLQILQQAAAAILAQANQQPALALALLKE